MGDEALLMLIYGAVCPYCGERGYRHHGRNDDGRFRWCPQRKAHMRRNRPSRRSRLSKLGEAVKRRLKAATGRETGKGRR